MNVEVVPASRRAFLGHIISATAFVVSAPLTSFVAKAQQGATAGDATRWDPSVYLGIETNGDVKIIAHRSEMGTGVRTSLPMIVAEEMEADWNRVKVQQAHGDEVKFGNQDTDGSRSTRHYLIPMRQIGAAARTMLEGATAKRWGVPVAEVKATNHEVVHAASGRRIGFGDLAADASKEAVPAIGSLKLKDPKDFRYLGKGEISIVDLHDITTGAAHYGADIRLPGLLDGVDLAQRVSVLWPHVSVIVTSGYAGSRQESLPQNVVYMQKPWLALDVLMLAERAAARMQGPYRAAN